MNDLVSKFLSTPATQSWAKSLKDKSGARVGTMLALDPRTPDETAEAMRVGEGLGLPANVVAADVSGFKRQLDQKKNTTALSGAPKTAKWLEDLNNGILAKDDIDNLSWFERNVEQSPGALTRGVGRGIVRTGAIVPELGARIDAQLVQDVGRTVEAIYQDELKRLGPNALPEMRATARQTAQARFEAVQGMGEEDRAAILQRGAASLSDAREVLDRAAAIPMNETATKFRDETLANAENTFLGTIKAFASDPVGGMSFIAQTAAEVLPILAASTATTAITRSPAAGVGAMSGGSFLTENANSAMEFLAEKGVDLSTPEAAALVLDDAELMQEAAERGVTRGLIIAMFDAVSGGIAGQALMKSPMGDVVAQGMSQMVLGGTGEAAAQSASGQEISWQDIVTEGLAELATAPVEVGGVAGRGILRNLSKSADAGTTAAAIDEIDRMAANSKLRERAPDKFAEALDAQGESDFYIAADDLREYFQAKDMEFDAETLEAWGIDPIDFRQAESTGGDVTVSRSAYATRISGTEDAAWFRDNAIRTPGEMSVSQSARFNSEVRDVMDQALADAEDQRTRDLELRDSDVKVYDNVFSQLRAAGRTRDVADNEARVWSSFWRTMADRYGGDPLELAQSMGVQIVGPQTPDAARRRNDLDINLNTLRSNPQRALRAEGTDLLDFVRSKGGISDTGGDVAAMDAPKGIISETRDEFEARRGQPNMLGLSDSKGTGLDEIGRAAIEAGYFPELMGGADVQSDGTVVDEAAVLLEALQRAISGEAIYPVGEGPNQDMVDLSNELSRRGIDLAMSNDEIAAALEDQGGQEYDQSGKLITDTPEFRAWFGDSKVVDENGDPLVVHHGGFGIADIEQFDSNYQGDTTGNNEAGAFHFVDRTEVSDDYARQSFNRRFQDNPEALIDEGIVDEVPDFGNDYDAQYEWVDNLATANMQSQSVYLRITNPVEIDMSGERVDIEELEKIRLAISRGYDEDGVLEKYVDAPAEVFEQSDIDDFKSEIDDYLSENYDVTREDADEYMVDEAVREVLLDNGFDPIFTEYDGVIIKNMIDDIGDASNIVADQYIAFKPEQIKSVYNRGTFDANDPRILYQFAGPYARTADKSAMDDAIVSLADGESAESVRERTGWIVGPDGALRFEISDREMAINEKFKPDDFPDLSEFQSGVTGPSGSRVRLSDVIKHDAIFEAYPRLSDTLMFSTSEQAVDGVGMMAAGIDPRGEMMVINRDFWESDEIPDSRKREAIIHEIQHLIQIREGRSKGSNMDGGRESYRGNMGEVEARTTQKRGNIPQEHLGFIPIEWDGNNIDVADTTARAVVMSDDLVEEARARVAAANEAAKSKADRGTTERLTAALSGRSSDLEAALAQDGRDTELAAYTVASLFARSPETFVEDIGKNTLALINDIQDANDPRILYQDQFDNLEAILAEFEGVEFAPERSETLDDVTRRLQKDRLAAAAVARDELVAAIGNRDSEAAWTEERLRSIIQEGEHSAKDESKFRIGFVDPLAFVEATADSPARIADEAGDLDVERLKADTQTPFITVKDGEIVGHEGRHRMIAMAKDGVKSAPILIRLRDGYENAGNKPSESFLSQTFTDGPSLSGSLDVSDTFSATSANEQAIIDRMMVNEPRILFQDGIESDLLAAPNESKMVGPEDVIVDTDTLKVTEAVNGGPNNGKSFRYVQYEDGRAVGVIQFRTMGKRTKKAEIQNIYTVKDKRRQKVAANLLRRAQQDFDVKHSNDLSDYGRAFKAADGKFYQVARGSIQLPSGGLQDGQTVINLFESANLSTFIHESGHFFLEAFTALATSDTAPQGMKDDLAAIHKFLKADGTAPLTTAQHEMWARAFEAYAMEGKAPSLALADAFGRFKSWLTRIYKTALGLNVKITPEIREVMDRMLATDAEIAAAREMQQMSPLFTSEAAAGMTPAAWETYQKMARRSEEQASQALLEKTMAKVRREKETWWKEERADVKKEVTTTVDSKPEYRLIEMLANQKWIGSDDPVPDFQLDRAELVETFGDGVLAELSRSRFGGKRAIYGADGISLYEAAEFFGFANPTEMVETLQNTGKKKDAIELETDRIMADRYGDPLNDGSIEEEAVAAIHSDQQAQTVAAEARHLASKSGKPTRNMTAKVFRQRARMMLSRMSVKDATRPNAFLEAERRSAKRAEDAFARTTKGRNAGESLAAAAKHKEQQMLNHYLYMESRDLTKMVASKREKMRNYSKASVREKLDGGYIEQIDALLEGYDFRVRSAGQIKRSEKLRAFVERMVEEGRERDLDIDERLLDEANRKHYTKMSVDELQGLFDTIENIDHMGRFKQKLVDAKNKRDLQEVADTFSTAISDRFGTGKAANQSKQVRNFFNLLFSVDTMMVDLDGTETGDVYDLFKAPLDRGQAQEQQMNVAMADAVQDIFSVYSSKELSQMQVQKLIPGGNGHTWSKMEIISLALNTGHQDGRNRILEDTVHPERRLTQDQLDALLDTLEKGDWDFVQSMLKQVNSYWPELAATHKRRKGTELKKVEAVPIETKFGVYPGGYYPLAYDSQRSIGAAKDEASAWDKFNAAGRGSRIEVKSGMTIARKENSGGRTLDFDLNVALRHMRDTIRVITMSEVVDNAARIIKHKDVETAFMDAGQTNQFNTLKLFLDDLAVGPVYNTDPINSFARVVKNNFTMAKLAFNFKTVALQVTGITQSAVVVGKRNMVRGYRDYLANPNAAVQMAMGKSAFMSERKSSFQKDIYDQVNDIQLSSPLAKRGTKVKNAVGKAGFYPMIRVQFLTVDVPTWIAAHDAKLREGATDEAAVKYADRIVARSQGSGLYADRNALERGTVAQNMRQSDFIRLWTTLGSYMVTKMNRGYLAAQKGKRGISEADNVGEMAGSALNMASDLALLYMAEAIMMGLAYALLAGDDADEEDLTKFIMTNTATSVIGGVPIVSGVANAFQGYGAGGVLASVLEMPANVATQLRQGENDAALWRSISDAGGMLTGLPSTATYRAIEGVVRGADEGELPLADMFFGSNPLTR